MWPASLIAPQTAFTIPVLGLYDHLWLISRVNVYDFMHVLQCQTHSAFPDKITVRVDSVHLRALY